jgi:hypothetical protein
MIAAWAQMTSLFGPPILEVCEAISWRKLPAHRAGENRAGDR